MTNIGLGDVARFPFVEPPDTRSINDGVALWRSSAPSSWTRRWTGDA
jgi:ATP-dependent helicase HrpA